ncbi:MAG: type II toxin-antitoxin system RelE/ParE family toxin [Bacteroidetes bacterium]|nr:type II toxin-antitoxin system RelE/ParE family toxin [Bacteroidota bacterium]
MALEIVWSKRADKKFDKILEYLSNEWGNNVTKSFVKKVYDFLDILSEFPDIGTLENGEKGIRGFVIIKQVSIFYIIRNNLIIILNFFDNRQSPNKKRF